MRAAPFVYTLPEEAVPQRIEKHLLIGTNKIRFFNRKSRLISLGNQAAVLKYLLLKNEIRSSTQGRYMCRYRLRLMSLEDR